MTPTQKLGLITVALSLLVLVIGPAFMRWHDDPDRLRRKYEKKYGITAEDKDAMQQDWLYEESQP